MRNNFFTLLCALCEFCGELFFAFDFQLSTVNYSHCGRTKYTSNRSTAGRNLRITSEGHSVLLNIVTHPSSGSHTAQNEYFSYAF
jgi:hypothetical protein